MLGLSRATRLLLLFGVACLIIWLVWLGIFYRSMALETVAESPAPADLAALTELVEATPENARAPLFQALAVGGDQLRIVDAAQARPALDPSLSPADSRLLATYRAALGDRPVTLWRQQPPAFDWILFRHLASKLPAMHFRIGLRSGDTLEIVTKSSPLITAYGVPVGYAAGFLGTLVALLALFIMHRERRYRTRTKPGRRCQHRACHPFAKKKRRCRTRRRVPPPKSPKPKPEPRG